MAITSPPIAASITDIPTLRLAITNALANLVAQINAQTQTAPFSMNNQRITNLANPAAQTDAVNLAALTSAIANVAPPKQHIHLTTGGTSVVNPIVSVELTLSSATTTITSPVAPTIGALCTVLLRQSSSGGNQIVWKVGTWRFAPPNISVVANDWSSFIFTGQTDPADSVVKWFMVAAALTGYS